MKAGNKAKWGNAHHFTKIFLRIEKDYHYFRSSLEKKGQMAEWLGTALQKLLHRFESGSDLQKKSLATQ